MVNSSKIGAQGPSRKASQCRGTGWYDWNEAPVSSAVKKCPRKRSEPRASAIREDVTGGRSGTHVLSILLTVVAANDQSRNRKSHGVDRTEQRLPRLFLQLPLQRWLSFM